MALGDDEAQDSAYLHPLAKLHPLHADGDKFAAGIIETGSNPGILVYSLEHVAAGQIAVMVEVFRKYQFVVFHSVVFLRFYPDSE